MYIYIYIYIYIYVYIYIYIYIYIYLTALQLCELCAEVSCIVCYIINDTKI